MYRHHVCLLLCFLPDYKSTELRSCSFLFNPKLIKKIQIDNSKYIVLTQEVIFYRFFFPSSFLFVGYAVLIMDSCISPVVLNI